MNERMICDDPTEACFRGECLLCDLGRWRIMAGVEWAAELLGMTRHFLLGRVNGFPGCQVR